MLALRIAGYVAFFLFSLLLSIYLTFPWDAAKDRVLDLASQESGMQITAESLEPSWFTGVEAKGVKVLRPEAEEPIDIPSLEARANVLALITGGMGGSVRLPIAKGVVWADVVSSSDTLAVDGEVKDVELALVPGLAGSIGMPLAGQVSLLADLEVNKEDPKASKGSLRVRGESIEILEGGKVSGFPVPALAVGSFDWTIPVSDGKARIEGQKITGENIEVVVDGEVTLNSPLSRSGLNLHVKFKPTPAFLKKEPLLGALLNNLRRAKGADGFYGYALAGSVKHPRFFPKRSR